VTDPKNPESSSGPVPPTEPDKTKSIRPYLVNGLIIFGLGFLFLVVVIPKFDTRGNGRTLDSDTKSNLHDLYLACKAYWADNGPDHVCTPDIAQQTAYGYVKSVNVEIVALGNEKNFKANATHAKDTKGKVFEVNSLGTINERKASFLEGWYLKNAYISCQSFWNEFGDESICIRSKDDDVWMKAFGNRSSFTGMIMNVNGDEEKTFTIDTKGTISKAGGTKSEKLWEEMSSLLVKADQLRQLFKACKAYWAAAGPESPCSEQSAHSHGFLGGSGKIEFGGSESFFKATINAEGDYDYIGYFYPLILRADGNIHSIDSSILFDLHQACERFWKATDWIQPCNVSQATRYGFAKPPGFQVMADGPQPYFTAVIKREPYNGLHRELREKLAVRKANWLHLKSGEKFREAIRQGHLEGIEWLISLGVKVDSQEGNLIQTAIDAGKPESVKYLLEQGIRVSLSDLRQAMKVKNRRMVEIMVSHGLDINSKTGYMHLPLFHEELRESNRDWIEFLIEMGADPNIKDGFERTSLMALSGGIVYGRNRPLHETDYHERLKVLDLLISKGVDVNAQDRSGDTVVHLLVQNTPRQIKMEYIEPFLKKLIALGADINLKNKHGITPLFLVLNRRKPEMAKGFIRHGADINLKNRYGVTPLDRALEFNLREVAKLIARRGGVKGDPPTPAEVARLGKFSKFNAIRQAALQKKDGRQYRALDGYYRQMGGPVGILSYIEKYPLHGAVLNVDEARVDTLIQQGADVNSVDYRGNKPLDVAILVCQETLVKKLIAHGADVNHKVSTDFVRVVQSGNPLQLAEKLCGQPMAAILTAPKSGMGHQKES